MLFPKDSTVWLAAWAIHQSDEEYPDHDRFNPDRFKNHTKLANEYAVGPDWQGRDKFPITYWYLKLTALAHHYGYGAGRRMCPGIHLAERSMWRVTAKLLWAFEFEELPDKPLDVNAYTSSNLVRPLEYEVKVTPRSKQHQEVISRELRSALDFVSQYDWDDTVNRLKWQSRDITNNFFWLIMFYWYLCSMCVSKSAQGGRVARNIPARRTMMVLCFF